MRDHTRSRGDEKRHRRTSGLAVFWLGTLVVLASVMPLAAAIDLDRVTPLDHQPSRLLIAGDGSSEPPGRAIVVADVFASTAPVTSDEGDLTVQLSSSTVAYGVRDEVVLSGKDSTPGDDVRVYLVAPSGDYLDVSGRSQAAESIPLENTVFEQDYDAFDDRGTYVFVVVSSGVDGEYGSDLGFDDGNELPANLSQRAAVALVYQEYTSDDADDQTVELRLPAKPPSLTLDDFTEDGQVVRGAVTVSGTSNREDGTTVFIEVLGENQNVVVSTETEVDGSTDEWSARLDLSRGEPGTYTLRADDDESTDSLEFELVDSLSTPTEVPPRAVPRTDEPPTDAPTDVPTEEPGTDEPPDDESTQQTGDEVNEPPIARFDYDLPNTTEDLSVTFDASDSTDDRGIVRYDWRFGDGGSATTRDESTVHTYDEAGVYTVTLTVTDTGGASHSLERRVEVDAPTEGGDGGHSDEADSLVARFTSAPAEPLVGETVRFDAGDSGETDRTIDRYEWTIGDDAPFVGTTVQTHEFAVPGRYPVTLTITDSSGVTATATQYVTVVPTAPLTLTTDPGQPTLNDTVVFTVSGPRIPQSRTATYQWDLTDDGVSDRTTTTPRLTHSYTQGGDHQVTVSLIIDGVAFASVTDSVTVHDEDGSSGGARDQSSLRESGVPDGSADPDGGTDSDASSPSDPAGQDSAGQDDPAQRDGGDDVTLFAAPSALVALAVLATVALLAYVGFVVGPAALAAEDSARRDEEDRQKRARLVVDAYHPRADEAEPLADEFVRFRNVGDGIADLSWATVEDSDGNVYTFPNEFLLEPDATVSLYTGDGSDGEYELYWGAEESVWHVESDRIVLTDALGNVLTELRYPE